MYTPQRHLEGFFVHKEEETGRETRGKEKAAKNRKRVLMAGRVRKGIRGRKGRGSHHHIDKKHVRRV